MPDPNFLVIGAQKSGTSWLSEMIGQHPEVLTARRKEVMFFGKVANYQKGIAWYREQFPQHRGEKAIGEFTPHYFWTHLTEQDIVENETNPNVHELVHQHYPDIKLILALRDPVRRAVSAYYHQIRPGRISPRTRILEAGKHYGIISMGHYYMHLCEWMRLFPREQFLILIYEDDIIRKKEQTLQRVFRFLGVDENFKPEGLDIKYNERRGHLYLHLRYYLPGLIWRMEQRAPAAARALKRIDFPKIAVSDEEIQVLARTYAESNRKLEELLGCELPWMS